MNRQNKVGIKLAQKLLLLLSSLILVIGFSLGYGTIFSVAQTPLPRVDIPRINPQINPQIDPELIQISIPISNWNFESGLRGWEKTGNAFDSQPTYRDNVIAARVIGNGTSYSMPLGGDYWRDTAFPIGHKGNYWIGTYENRPNTDILRGRIQGDIPQGTLTSQPFTIRTNYITFLISGGNDTNRLKIELLEETSPNNYRPVAGTAKTGRNNELFRREWWEVRALKGRKARIQIVDNASGGWGHINIDDIKFQDTEPPYSPPPEGADLPTLTAFKDGDVWRDLDFPIWGFVDLHTHPMSYLGFGKKLVHGATDIGAIIPAGTRDCNPRDRRATSIQEALGHDNSTHGGKGLFDNPCGDDIRKLLINTLENELGAQSQHGSGSFGYSDDPRKAFVQWPRFNDITHQQMWVDWIYRSYQGGLRVMVALAVNNKTLADGLQADPPTDDKGSADLQINEIKDFVSNCRRRGVTVTSNCDFMELATNPNQLRSIVRRNKLAVVVGVEIDEIGNFNKVAAIRNDGTVSAEEKRLISSEIQRLYDVGVRYVFPIHLTDNKFGGTAVYENIFNYSNKREYGSFWDLECSEPKSGIKHRVQGSGLVQLATLLLGQDPFRNPPIPTCNPDVGHRNRQGITAEGDFAIRELMRRGMMIDIDHMSQYSADKTLEIAGSISSSFSGGYPINSGHNGFRSNGGTTENTRTDAQIQKIRSSGGLMGVGFGGSVSCDFLTNYRFGFGEARMNGKQLAIGTDINVLVKAPKPRFGSNSDESGRCSSLRVNYSGAAALTMAQTGSKRWNYNTEGFAHYGIFPDFLQDLKNIGMTAEERTTFFLTAEDFAQMWKKSQLASSYFR